MLLISKINIKLKNQMKTEKLKNELEKAKRQYSNLYSFENGEDLVAFLNKKDKRLIIQQSLIIAILIYIYQTEKKDNNSCWISILICAYIPALLKFRNSIFSTKSFNNKDLDMLVIESFTEAVIAFSFKAPVFFAAKNLIWETKKNVMNILKRQMKMDKVLLFGELKNKDLEEFVDKSPKQEKLCLLNQQKLELNKIVKLESLDELSLFLLNSYMIVDEPFIEQIRKLHQDMNENDFKKTYEKYRRQRSRLIKKLQKNIFRCPNSRKKQL